MASRMRSSHSSLFRLFPHQSLLLLLLLVNFKFPNLASSPKRLTLHSKKASLHPNTHAPQKDTDSHDPDENSSSLSKNRIWVNPNHPRAKHLRTKSRTARYSYLARLTESLNSCTPTAENVSAILKGLGDNVSERDAVFILDKMVNSETAPFVLRYFRDMIKPTKIKRA